GQASTTWTLGPTLGAQSMTAVSAGLTPNPLTIAATGTGAPSGPATALFFFSAPGTVAAGSPFSVVVQARDSAGQVATSFTGTVTISIATNPAGGTLSGTTSVAAVAGVATFSNLSIDKSSASNYQ